MRDRRSTPIFRVTLLDRSEMEGKMQALAAYHGVLVQGVLPECRHEVL